MEKNNFNNCNNIKNCSNCMYFKAEAEGKGWCYNCCYYLKAEEQYSAQFMDWYDGRIRVSGDGWCHSWKQPNRI